MNEVKANATFDDGLARAHARLLTLAARRRAGRQGDLADLEAQAQAKAAQAEDAGDPALAAKHRKLADFLERGTGGAT